MNDAFELFGEVGLSTADFDKGIARVETRLRDASGRFIKTGQDSAAFGQRVNGVSSALAELEQNLNRAEQENRRMGNTSARSAREFEKQREMLAQMKREASSVASQFTLAGQADDSMRGKLKQLEAGAVSFTSKLKDMKAGLTDTATRMRDNEVASASWISRLEKIRTVSGDLRSAGMSLTAGITLPLTAGAIAATKFASDLQQSVANISTIKPEIDTSQVFRALNEMQTRVPYSAEQLGASLYDVFGTLEVTQKQGLALVEKFARGATGAMTDAAVFGSAIMGEMGAFGKGVDDVDHVMDVFFNTVNRASNMTGSQLAPNLGKVSAMAGKAGVSLEEMSAMLVAATKGGGEASENINNVANLLQKLPTPEAQKKMQDLLKVAGTADGKFRPVLDVMADLKAKLAGLSESDAARVLAEIFPDAQAQTGAIAVMKFLDAANNALAENRTETNATAKAFEKMIATFISQATLLKGELKAAFTRIGESILPALQPIIAFLAEKLPLAANFIVDAFNLLPASLQGAAGAFAVMAAILGPVLAALGGIGAVVAVLGGEVVAVALAIGAGLAMMVAQVTAIAVAIYQAWSTNFAGIRDLTNEVWAAISEGISTALGFIQEMWVKYGAALLDSAASVWNGIKAVVNEAATAVVTFIREEFGQVIQWVRDNWPLIKETIENNLNAIKAIVSTVLGAVSAFWKEHGETIKTVVGVAWNAITTVVRAAVGIILDVVTFAMATLNGNWAKAWDAFRDIVRRGIDAAATVMWSLLTITAQVAAAALIASYQIGANIVLGILQGMWNLSPAGLITNAILSITGQASANAAAGAYQQGLAVGASLRAGVDAGVGSPTVGGDLQGRPGIFTKAAPKSTFKPSGGGGGGGGKGGGGDSTAERLAKQALEGMKLNLRDFENLSAHKLAAEQRAYDAGLKGLKEYNDNRIRLEKERYEKEKEVLLAEQAFIADPKNKFGAGERELKSTEIGNQLAAAQRKHEDTTDSIKAEGQKRRLELDRVYAERQISIAEAANRTLEGAQSDAVRKGLTTFIEAENVRFQKEQEVFAKRQALVNADLARYEKGDQDKLKEAQQANAALANEQEAALQEHNRRQDEARRRDLESAQSYTRALRAIYSDISSINRETLSIQLRALEDNQLRRVEFIRLTAQLEHAAAAERSKEIVRELEERREALKIAEMDERQRAALIKAIDEEITAEKRRSAAERVDIERQAAERTRQIYREIASDLKGIFKDVFGSIGDGWRGLLNSMLSNLKSIFLNVASELFENFILKILDPQQAQKGSQAGGIVGAITNAILGIGKKKGSQSPTVGSGTVDATPADLSQVTIDRDSISDLTKAGDDNAGEIITSMERSGAGLVRATKDQTTKLSNDLAQLAREICQCGQKPQEPGWAKWARLALSVGQMAVGAMGEGGGGGGGGGDPEAGGSPPTGLPPVLKNPDGSIFVPKKAAGGLMHGPGTSTSDSIPAMLSSGEYVIRAAVVSALGVGFFDALNGGGSVPGAVHLAGGGMVGSSPSSTGYASSSSSPGDTINIYLEPHFNNTADTPAFRQSMGQVASNAFAQAAQARNRYQ